MAAGLRLRTRTRRACFGPVSAVKAPCSVRVPWLSPQGLMRPPGSMGRRFQVRPVPEKADEERLNTRKNYARRKSSEALPGPPRGRACLDRQDLMHRGRGLAAGEHKRSVVGQRGGMGVRHLQGQRRRGGDVSGRAHPCCWRHGRDACKGAPTCCGKRGNGGRRMVCEAAVCRPCTPLRRWRVWALGCRSRDCTRDTLVREQSDGPCLNPIVRRSVPPSDRVGKRPGFLPAP